MHLVLEVNTEKAVESVVERNFQEIRELVEKNQIQNVSVERPSPLKISVQVQGKENIDKFKALLDKELRDLRISSRREDAESYAAVLDLPDKESDADQENVGGPGPRNDPQPRRPVRRVPNRTSGARAKTGS